MPSDLKPGRVIASRYEVRVPLGKGGMGTVYEAHDRILDEVVALKVLRTSDETGEHEEPPERGERLKRRFRAEIKLARRIRHPNVCAIHEYGEDGDLLFISMECVQGRNLKKILEEDGPFAWEDAYDVAIQVARGLAAIHDSGIIHRDLKTTNVMRDTQGRVRIMDFGIAKLWAQESPALTATHSVVGSPQHMSPEQIRAEPLDTRSDLYSFGTLLWEVFTRRVPFEAATPVATMMKHLQDDPPYNSLAATRPPESVVPLLRRALAKRPDDGRTAPNTWPRCSSKPARTGSAVPPTLPPTLRHCPSLRGSLVRLNRLLSRRQRRDS